MKVDMMVQRLLAVLLMVALVGSVYAVLEKTIDLKINIGRE